ncbi:MULTISPECIES: CPBP family intramembrane glutamic endopeptidase [Moorena]|uniref:Abortive phage infection protein n=1 Tax=Moorena bouillonii PNG TaxID=568701 RepID=A0A1U7N7Z9_9CYAN|nr:MULTISPECIES: CPBP family intramembrane glutamic endopeptidase [Moorena]NEO18145.1 CPBP family intramembrane metalloprotease [Moorena sp. SIO4A5]NEQ57572.1 CPBP family intramembrane metalloprotease [Moorena sp. SIO4A1]OLT62080.1 abortive phage infection protein [Moorena bouillonii PNG]
MTKQIPDNPELEPLTRIQVLVAMGITAVVLLIFAKLWLQLGKLTLLPIKFTPNALVIGLAMGLGITAASGLVYRLWPAYRQSAEVYLKLILKPLIIPDLMWLGLLPGMSEELLFRGVMLPAVGLNAIGIIASSMLFGILHLSGIQQWPYVVWATLVGLLLGYSAVATDNLLVPIVAHIVTNFVSSLVWKLGNLENTT